MKLDPTKTAIWVFALASFVSVLMFRQEHKAPPPVAPVVVEQPVEAPPVVVAEPAPLPPVTVPVTPPHKPVVKAPVPAPAAPKVEPKVEHKPVAPKVAAAKPKFKKKAPVPVAQRRNTSRCSMVPAEAYAHSTTLVMATAAGRGLPPEALATLRWCIGG